MKISPIAVAVAAFLCAAPAAHAAETAYLLDGGDIVIAPVDRPEQPFATLPITVLPPGDTISAMDLRPKDGKLYALVRDATPTPDDFYLYAFDVSVSEAVAGPVGGPLDIDPVDGLYELEFNPVSDRARVVSSAGQIFRINPVNGAMIDGDPNTIGTQPDSTLTYAPGDPFGSGTADIDSIAHTDNRDGATSSTLLGLVHGEPTRLVRIGGPGGVPSASGGVVTTLAQLSFPGDFVLLDASEESGLAYATAVGLDPTSVHRIDPASYVSTPIGVREGFVREFVLAPAATIGFAADAATAGESSGKGVVEVTRTGGAAGAMSVGWTAGSGTAVAGQDFPVASGTVEFADGETSKSLEVPLTNDGASEGRESLLVELGEPTGNRAMGALLGRARTTVVIEDDDTAAPAPVVPAPQGNNPVPDTSKPRVVLSGVPRTIKRASLLRGFTIRATPDEAAELTVSLRGTPRRGARISAFELELFTHRLARGAGTRALRVRPKRVLVGPVRRPVRLRLLVEAVDAAGNRTTVARTIRVTR